MTARCTIVEPLAVHVYLSDNGCLCPLQHQELIPKFHYLVVVVDAHEDAKAEPDQFDEALVSAAMVECRSKDLGVIHLSHVLKAVG
jgi:hypothetical protein